MKHKFIWAGAFTLLLVLFSVFTMLDAFVFPKVYSQTISGNDDSVPADAPQNEPLIDNDSYINDNINIYIERCSKDGAVYYVADIQLASVDYLRTAFANNTYGKNVTQPTSKMASDNNAIFAINGDYYGFRDNGIVIRNGILYRDVPRSAPDNQSLTIDINGNMDIVTEKKGVGQSLIDSSVLQAFSFGPVLVKDGVAAKINTKSVSETENPRTAIGQISPLHYIFIVVDGRTSDSSGMTLEQLTNVFLEKGCNIAYNLDGGGSSTMWFKGKVINVPIDGKSGAERSVSDIIYIPG
ncbi:MAG: phosphodiester glycosidase family protein [Clostridiales bacterium]|jgi:exopolysaccharide biosynthesis protein|nr:phosphodiester glycosidase family protein [Clostridiales bacterium]